MKEMGLDPRAVSSKWDPRDKPAAGGRDKTIKGVQASRRRREHAAAAALGMDAPADPVHHLNSSASFGTTRTSSSSIRRARLRREQAAIESMEKEQRAREKAELAELRRAEQQRECIRQEWLQKARELEGIKLRRPIWRRFLSSVLGFRHPSLQPQSRQPESSTPEPEPEQQLYEL